MVSWDSTCGIVTANLPLVPCVRLAVDILENERPALYCYIAAYIVSTRDNPSAGTFLCKRNCTAAQIRNISDEVRVRAVAIECQRLCPRTARTDFPCPESVRRGVFEPCISVEDIRTRETIHRIGTRIFKSSLGRHANNRIRRLGAHDKRVIFRSLVYREFCCIACVTFNKVVR